MYACITQRSVPTAGAACCDIPDVSPRKGTPRARQQVKTGGPDVQTRAWPMDMDARVPIQIDMNEVTCGGPFKSLALACRLKARIMTRRRSGPPRSSSLTHAREWDQTFSHFYQPQLSGCWHACRVSCPLILPGRSTCFLSFFTATMSQVYM
jgi:hypothetical protein